MLQGRRAHCPNCLERISRGSAGGDERIDREVRMHLLGTEEQADRLLAGISELAQTIDTSRATIIYGRRSQLPVNELSVREQWEIFADGIRLGPGAERRHHNARRYLWQRPNAEHHRFDPEPRRRVDRPYC